MVNLNEQSLISLQRGVQVKPNKENCIIGATSVFNLHCKAYVTVALFPVGSSQDPNNETTVLLQVTHKVWVN